MAGNVDPTTQHKEGNLPDFDLAIEGSPDRLIPPLQRMGVPLVSKLPLGKGNPWGPSRNKPSGKVLSFPTRPESPPFHQGFSRWMGGLSLREKYSLQQVDWFRKPLYPCGLRLSSSTQRQQGSGEVELGEPSRGPPHPSTQSTHSPQAALAAPEKPSRPK